MTIGEKLRAARTASGLTQERVAQEIGVSRQSVSNWENDRTYPDIMSVIRLSDLYGVSLDVLLKGDGAMIAHIEEETSTVKSHRRLAHVAPVLAYLVVWALLLALFWFGSAPDDAMGYALIAFYVVLPVATLVTSALVGVDPTWGRLRWLVIPAFGVMFMLATYCTFDLANALAFDKVNLPNPGELIPGLVMAAIGYGLGVLWSKSRQGARAIDETITGS